MSIKINKQLIGSLLGGGVTVLAASFGGVKLNDTLNYNRKVYYYEGVRKLFDSNPDATLKKEWYFPKWENETLWKKQFERKDIKKYYKTAEEFRDWCYAKLKKASDQEWVGQNNCSAADDKCMDCFRRHDWN